MIACSDDVYVLSLFLTLPSNLLGVEASNHFKFYTDIKILFLPKTSSWSPVPEALGRLHRPHVASLCPRFG